MTAQQTQSPPGGAPARTAKSAEIAEIAEITEINRGQAAPAPPAAGPGIGPGIGPGPGAVREPKAPPSSISRAPRRPPADTASTEPGLAELSELAELEGHLGHTFRDRRLLLTALTHKSYVNEKGAGREHNERLEFLGDAVLSLAVAHLLMAARPERDEGELSLMRSRMVSEASLAALAAHIDLGRWLRLGRGEEQSGGRSKPSLLADAYEAVLGALYLDTSFDYALGIVERLVGAQVERVLSGSTADYKSTLQELLQGRRQPRPRYEVVSTSGPDHDKVFEVAVHISEHVVAHGRGRSKREAEHRAAEDALRELNRIDRLPSADAKGSAAAADAAPAGSAAPAEDPVR